MTPGVSVSEALFTLIAGLAFAALLVGVVCLLVAAIDAVLGELAQIFWHRRSSAPARETAPPPSVSRALSELGSELDRIGWQWSSTSTADAGQASAVESRRPSEEEALWTRA